MHIHHFNRHFLVEHGLSQVPLDPDESLVEIFKADIIQRNLSLDFVLSASNNQMGSLLVQV